MTKSPRPHGNTLFSDADAFIIRPPVMKAKFKQRVSLIKQYLVRLAVMNHDLNEMHNQVFDASTPFKLTWSKAYTMTVKDPLRRQHFETLSEPFATYCTLRKRRMKLINDLNDQRIWSSVTCRGFDLLPGWELIGLTSWSTDIQWKEM